MPEFEIPDMGGDPSDPPADPLEGKGAEGAASEAGNAAIKTIPKTLPGGLEIPSSVAESLPDIVNDSIKSGMESVPTVADGTMGQSIQADVAEQIKSNPDQLHDSALHDALKNADGDPSKITRDQLQKAYDDNVKNQVEQSTQQYKTQFKDAVKDSLTDSKTGTSIDPDIDSTRDYNGKNSSVLDQMVDDPKGTEEKLKQDADDIQKKNPDWKERLKENGKKLFGYGLKGLLVLSLIGAFLPGGSNVIDKLTQMASDAASKVINVALNIIKTFLGPFIKSFWSFIKAFRGPLIVVGSILVFLLVLWVLKEFKYIFT